MEEESRYHGNPTTLGRRRGEEMQFQDWGPPTDSEIPHFCLCAPEMNVDMLKETVLSSLLHKFPTIEKNKSLLIPVLYSHVIS